MKGRIVSSPRIRCSCVQTTSMDWQGMVNDADRAARSRMMAKIGPKDTAPELAVRRYLHAAGLRFRLHCKGLPGRPDIVLPQHRVVIFVHGCFWHRHNGCRFATDPATNVQF